MDYIINLCRDDLFKRFKETKVLDKATNMGGRGDKSRLTIVSTWNTEFILVFINYFIIFHVNNCKPTFAPPYIKWVLIEHSSYKYRLMIQSACLWILLLLYISCVPCSSYIPALCHSFLAFKVKILIVPLHYRVLRLQLFLAWLREIAIMISGNNAICVIVWLSLVELQWDLTSRSVFHKTDLISSVR